MQPLLEVNHVGFSYHSESGETTALSDITFSLKEGEFVSIVGPSGCGKSTLLSLISGLLVPESGQILLHGQDVRDFHTGIGYMLQKDHLFEWRTIWQNVLLGLEIQKRISRKTMEHTEEMLKDYGLLGFKQARPSQLSGGMRQRAALIRTLALDPDLLLLDEPFSALDFQTRLAVCDDVWTILRREKKTAILVTHDLSEAVSMADRVLVLTKRPATICADICIQFKKENATPFERRSEPEFKDYFNEIWKELNLHG